MTEHFINQALKASVAALCLKMGWDASQISAIDCLADLWRRQLLQIGKTCHRYAEHYGRSEVNHDDIALAFRDMNISISELEEYVQNFDPVRLPYRTPSFPVSKQSHLNFLRPGSAEVLTRPVHIHEYMPPWSPTDEKPETQSGEVNGFHEKDAHSSSALSVQSAEVVKVAKDAKEVAIKVEPEPESILGLENESTEERNNEVENSEQQSALAISFSPFTGSSKRGNTSGENPALKRVRILMEEEGHPLREISSVMMTTSGFLSSSREGRLPEFRPPPNRDFFEPEPVVEKKKKIVTMKKIVEGVKKIDKEKENQDDVELFGKPDKLITPEIRSKSEAPKKSKDKDKSSKTGSSSNDKNKLKQIDKDSKSDKLKIFKKKSSHDLPSKHRKEDKVKVEIKLEPEVEHTLNNERFVPDFIKQEVDVSEDHRRKHKESSRKIKKREQRLVPGVIPIPRVSPNLIIPEIIHEESDELRKRQKSRKSSLPLTFGEDQRRKSSSKKVRHGSLKSLIPEISINVTKPLPPPPELKPFLGTMSMVPGLIPTNFGPPPPLRLGGSSLSPSITITPANTGISASGKEGRKSSSGTLPLPSNVCSSVTITRIDMPKGTGQYHDTSSSPGIGLHLGSGKQSPLPVHTPDSTSGITITPILMTGDHPPVIKTEKPAGGGGLAKLEEDLRSKEQRRKEKEKRKELKKEKKKEKREKDKERDRGQEKMEKHRSEKKEKVKERRKESTTTVEPMIPKLTLKLHSNASTPVDSPSRITERNQTPPPPPRKITIKPIEDIVKKRTPSPELARFSPLVTRQPKKEKISPSKPSPPVPVPVPVAVVEKHTSSEKKKSRSKRPSASSKGSSQSGLVTETVGFYVDAHGNKVWICPAVGCGREDDGSPMIGCDMCDDWYHFACVGIEETPDDSINWYCPRCIKKGARKGR